VSSTVIAKFGLKVVPQPHPYRMTWINSYALAVKQRCLVPIDLVYKDMVRCRDYVCGSYHSRATMVVQQRCYHLWSLKHVLIWVWRKEDQITSLPPKTEQAERKYVTMKKTNSISLINVKAFSQDVKKGAPIVIHTIREVILWSSPKSPSDYGVCECLSRRPPR